MKKQTVSHSKEPRALRCDLGHFEGYNYQTERILRRRFTAADILHWNDDRLWDVAFRPAGDVPEVEMLFPGGQTVTASELSHLERLLLELGGPSRRHFLQIHFAVNGCGEALSSASAKSVRRHGIHIFSGATYEVVCQKAAVKLFKRYHAEEYRFWKHRRCQGLIFDARHYLQSRGLWVEVVKLEAEVILLVAAKSRPPF